MKRSPLVLCLFAFVKSYIFIVLLQKYDIIVIMAKNALNFVDINLKVM